MRQLSTIIVTTLFSYVTAQSGAWGQCGGVGWSGATTCVSGYYCSSLNPYYSQCLPGNGPTGATTTPVAPTTSSTTVSRTPTRGTTSSTTRITTISTPTTTPRTTMQTTIKSTTSTTRITTTSSGPAPSGTAIRGVSAPVYHKYLQNMDGTAILGPEGTQAKFIISGGTIRMSGTGLYLNLDTSATTSYKALSFGTTATFSGWGLEGDTIITTQTSQLGRQLNYVMCGPVGSDSYVVYLQTGSQLPPGPGTCTNYLTMHLPCLC
ncbi:hypothetical protein ABW20_dc0104072 [Dactylellina cionopaga]|nr:hypothetical protein ABW20_dc0104072 [Dactylellina cionopaga]